MDDKVRDIIFTIVKLLAKAATLTRLSPMEADILNRNVEALLPFEGEEFIHTLLGMIKEAHGVLTADVSGKLKAYP
jgi:hypothetical protein